jgi:hypothetical protein
LAESAQYPEVKKELLWLAEGYERLASAPDIRRMAEGHRVLEIADAPGPARLPANVGD